MLDSNNNEQFSVDYDASVGHVAFQRTFENFSEIDFS